MTNTADIWVEAILIAVLSDLTQKLNDFLSEISGSLVHEHPDKCFLYNPKIQFPSIKAASTSSDIQ